MVQSIRVPHDGLTGQVEITCGATFPTDVIDTSRGIQHRISRGFVEQSYNVEVNFSPVSIGQPPMPDAVHERLQQLIIDRAYPEFFRALATALEGGIVDAVKPSERKAKLVIPPKPPKPKRQIRFLDRG